MNYTSGLVANNFSCEFNNYICEFIAMNYKFEFIEH